MKKIVSVVLVSLMSLSLIACGNNKVKDFDQLDTSKFHEFLNGEGHSGVWFADCDVSQGDTLNLTLSKEGFESISFTVTVQ